MSGPTATLTYPTQRDGHQVERELPLRLLVMGDFTGQLDPRALEHRPAPEITSATFDQILAGCRPRLTLVLADQLRVDLAFASLADFAPAGVGEQIPTIRDLLALRTQLSAGRSDPARLPATAPRARADLDEAISHLDQRVSELLDQILHHPHFQALEAAWRGVHLLTTQAARDTQIVIHVLAVTAAELSDDFEDAPELTSAGLYRQVYHAGYGQFGGEPFAALIGLYEFGSTTRDVQLLHRIAAIAAVAHAPFISGAAPRMFGLDTWHGLAQLTHLDALFDGPQYHAWRAFRASADARSVGLALPRCLLRQPWSDDALNPAFPYRERVSHDANAWLWGNPALAVASRLIASFAAHRWCLQLCGPQAGLISGLPDASFAGLARDHARAPLEVVLSERHEGALSALGFIPLSAGPGGTGACLHSAASCHAPTTGDLGAQLPYLFVINRLAHYLKVIQRENVGTWKERSDLERELNAWLGQLVIDMDDPEPAVRDRHPLRGAQVTVDDVADGAGWYRVAIAVRPHLTHLGKQFTLSLVGKLDRRM